MMRRHMASWPMRTQPMVQGWVGSSQATYADRDEDAVSRVQDPAYDLLAGSLQPSFASRSTARRAEAENVGDPESHVQSHDGAAPPPSSASAVDPPPYAVDQAPSEPPSYPGREADTLAQVSGSDDPLTEDLPEYRRFIGASPGYDPSQRPLAPAIDTSADIDALAQALTTKESVKDVLIRVLTGHKYRNPWSVARLRSEYKATVGRELIEDIKQHVHGDFETAVCSLIRGPLGSDVHHLKKTLRNIAFDEPLVMSILLGRSNADIEAILIEYRQTSGSRTLWRDVKTDTNAQRSRLYVMALSRRRADENAPVVPSEVNRRVDEIHRAALSKNTDDKLFIAAILQTSNRAQLCAIADAFEEKFQQSLLSMLSEDLSGRNVRNMGDYLRQMLALVETPQLAAEDLHASLRGKHRIFINKIMRFWWSGEPLTDVMGSYLDQFKVTLEKDVESELSGLFQRFMLALVSGMR